MWCGRSGVGRQVVCVCACMVGGRRGHRGRFAGHAEGVVHVPGRGASEVRPPLVAAGHGNPARELARALRGRGRRVGVDAAGACSLGAGGINIQPPQVGGGGRGLGGGRPHVVEGECAHRAQHREHQAREAPGCPPIPQEVSLRRVRGGQGLPAARRLSVVAGVRGGSVGARALVHRRPARAQPGVRRGREGPAKSRVGSGIPRHRSALPR